MSCFDPVQQSAALKQPVSAKEVGCQPSRDNELLRGVVQANQLLLTATSLPAAIPAALACLGTAIAADRAGVYQHHPHPQTQEAAMSLRFEWTRDHVPAKLPDEAWQHLPYSRSGLERWLAAFQARQPILGSVEDFPASERLWLAASQVQSVLLLPVFVEHHLWGVIGFESCCCDRPWTEMEQTIVQAVADSLGGAIAHQKHIAALQASELRLQKLANTLPGMLFQCDLSAQGQLTFSYLSEGCQTIFGLAASEVNDQMLVALTHRADRARIRRTFLKSAKTLQRLEVTWRIVSADQREKWVQASATPEQLEEGGVRWHGVLFDVSDRRAADSQLKFQEAFLRSIYDGVANRIFALQVEPDDRITYSGHNRAAEIATGWLSDSVNGVSPVELFGPDEGRAIEALCRSCIAQGSPITQEEHLTLGGKEAWVLTTFNPLRDTTGRVHRIIGTSFDITPMKQAQMELKQQLRMSAFRAEIDSLLTRGEALRPMLQGCSDVTVKYLDAALARIWIFNPDEQVLELQTSAGLYPHLESSYLRVPLGHASIGQIARAMQPYHTNELDTDPLMQDWVWAKREGIRAFAGYPLIVDGYLQGVMALFTHQPLAAESLAILDTVADEIALGIKRKQTEVQLQRSEQQLRHQANELQTTLQELRQTQSHLVQSEKMSSLGQLVAGVAHEINNPVNFIYGNLAHARNYAEDLLNLVALFQTHYPVPHPDIQAEAEAMDLEFVMEDLPKLLNSMKVGAERIQAIVSSLRTFSRMDEAEMKAVNLHDGLESTLMILQNRLKAKSMAQEIEVRRQYGELPVVECYAGQLNQVFMNILSNAIDALEEQRVDDPLTAPPPRIVIETGLNPQNQIEIRIQDNGPGIPEKSQARLFDPFFTTKPIGKGTGMGLSISYQIVTEKHGGRLTCDSQVGKGTTFTITIPCKQPQG